MEKTHPGKPMDDHTICCRELPNTCIKFSSPTGRRIFLQALTSAHMECYFALSEQFQTQDKPNLSGLTSLVIVLSTLEVNRNIVGKECAAGHHNHQEFSLDCCLPSTIITKTGMTMEQFTCVAACNTLEVQTVSWALMDKDDGSLESFRKTILDVTQQVDRVMIAHYSPKVLQQYDSGGHFSPIGGYHPRQDLVLILDTARYRYPPFWVPLKILWEAMHALEDGTDQPRGHIILRRSFTKPLRMLKLSDHFLAVKQTPLNKRVLQFINQMCDLMAANRDIHEDALKAMDVALSNLNDKEYVLTTQMDANKTLELSGELGDIIHDQISCLEATPLYQVVINLLKAKPMKHAKRCGKTGFDFKRLLSPEEGQNTAKLTLRSEHFITALLLAWPLETFKPKPDLMYPDQVRNASKAFQNEITQLSVQIREHLRFIRKNNTGANDKVLKK